MSNSSAPDLFAFDKKISEEGFCRICGVDEAGRGPLAGPVCAAAVVLPADVVFTGLNDSKKLSVKTRDRLFDEIIEKALDYGVAFVDAEEIDSLNILRATFLAMRDAVGKLTEKPDIVLVDGNGDPGFNPPSRCIIGGDGKSAAIAAASVLAKVSRDRYMAEMAKKYPQYGFDKHKGYGTKLHYERLLTYGPSAIHRRTFLRKLHGGG